MTTALARQQLFLGRHGLQTFEDHSETRITCTLGAAKVTSGPGG